MDGCRIDGADELIIFDVTLYLWSWKDIAISLRLRAINESNKQTKKAGRTWPMGERD